MKASREFLYSNTTYLRARVASSCSFRWTVPQNYLQLQFSLDRR